MLPPIHAEPVAEAPSHWGIRARLLALLLPGIAALLAFDSWNDYRALVRTTESAYDQALLEPVFALDDAITLDRQGEVDLSLPFSVQAMFESTQALHKHLHVGLTPLDPGGAPAGPERTLIGVADLPAPADVAPQAAQADGHGGAIMLYDAHYRSYAVRIVLLRRVVTDGAGRPYQLRVQAAESTGRRAQAQQALLRRELWQDARILAVTVLLVWLGVAWTLRPLERLRRALRQRAPDALAPLDATQVPYEVAPLVEAVNHHIADHQQLLAQQARFLADASHQLRTPLAIMMTQAGYALRESDPAHLREALHAIVAQLDRSRRLSDQLLALAHASRAGAETLPLADLEAVARGVLLQYLPLANEKNLDMGWQGVHGDAQGADGGANAAPALPVRAQAAELHEALANLLHNAIRHTPAGGRITVAARAEGGQAVAEVRDSGPGIAPAQRAAVFERFQRGGSGGAGLGLAIARAYAQRNGGDVVLADGEGEGGAGLCARLVLPMAPSGHS